MSKRLPHSPSRITTDIVEILGEQIRAARRERRWQMKELASRAGISENTLRSIETGAPTVAIGSYVEVAALVGIVLYGDLDERDALRAAVRGRLPLLGQRVRRGVPKPVNDDF